MLSPSDEQLHGAARPHRFWNESYYFSFLNAESGWGGAARIAFSPNQECKDGFIIFFFPDGKAGFIRCWQRTEGEAPADSPVVVEGMEFRCLEPYRSWRLRYDGAHVRV